MKTFLIFIVVGITCFVMAVFFTTFILFAVTQIPEQWHQAQCAWSAGHWDWLNDVCKSNI